MHLAKLWIRLAEALLTPRNRTLRVNGQTFTVCRSIWWDDIHSNKEFEEEIELYFAALPSRNLSHVIDAGAATGLFTIPLMLAHPDVRTVTFEPSRRQRILLKRNLRKNGLRSRTTVEPSALWNREEMLSFRSHGAISSIRGVGGIPLAYPHTEKVAATTLDGWSRRHPDCPIDLIKMDVEGAEVEIIEGARHVLETCRPLCLIQAYHIRDGHRTFETCLARLEALGYCCREYGQNTGLLVAVPRSERDATS